MSRAFCFGVLVFLWGSACEPFLFALDPPIEGYRSRLEGLRNVSISSFDIREDGRYLFYTSGSASWGVVDLQDTVTGSSVLNAAETPVVGVFLVSANRLAVVSRSGIQYVDVSDVFDPEVESEEYEFPTSAETELQSACRAGSRIFTLEVHPTDDDGHLIRKIFNDTEEDRVDWTDLIPSLAREYTPLGLRCQGEQVFVLSDRLGEIYLHRFSASASSLSVAAFNLSDAYEDYSLQDLSFEPEGGNFLVLMNRLVEENEEEDSLLIRIRSTNFSDRVERAVGQGGQAISFFRRQDKLHYGVFIETDLLENIVSERLPFRMLRIAADQFATEAFLEDRGTGFTQGETKDPNRLSEWKIPSGDSYAIGLVEASGLSLVSSAVDIRLVDLADEIPLLTEATPLSFQLLAPFDADYEIRFSEEIEEDGESSAINLSYGREVASGEIEANIPLTLTISVEDLRIRQNRLHAVTITATQKRAEEPNLIARRGLLFRYDPPPSGVRNFRLGYGDQAIFVFFEAGDLADDISQYLIYFSYDVSSLSTLPNSSIQLAAYEESQESVELLDGRTIRSPLRQNSFSNRKFKIPIAPIENQREIFVRVQALDEAGQFSEDNPEALGLAPLATRTLPGALGSPETCQLRAGAGSSPFNLWMGMLLMGIFILGQKKWAQRLRNRRGGD